MRNEHVLVGVLYVSMDAIIDLPLELTSPARGLFRLAVINFNATNLIFDYAADEHKVIILLASYSVVGIAQESM